MAHISCQDVFIGNMVLPSGPKYALVLASLETLVPPASELNLETAFKEDACHAVRVLCPTAASWLCLCQHRSHCSCLCTHRLCSLATVVMGCATQCSLKGAKQLCSQPSLPSRVSFSGVHSAPQSPLLWTIWRRVLKC